MAAKSISETKQVRYLLGLSSPAEREHIESKYFEDDDAFQEMLLAEDDLIDAYARGDLTAEEQQKFEKVFLRSLGRMNRVRFARVFTETISATQPVENKFSRTFLDLFKIFQSPALFRTTSVVAIIIFAGVLAWVLIDRRRITDELHALRAESSRLHTRTEALQRHSETDRTRTAEIPAQLTALPDKPRHSKLETTATQRTGPSKTKISASPILGRKFESLPGLQPTTSHEGQAAAGRLDGATVRGTVTDPQGNLVSNATVTLTNIDHLIRAQLTNKDGTYIFNSIPPGTYALKVTAPGFKTTSASDLHALISTSTVRDVQLEVGLVSEIVEEFRVVTTEDATLGSAFVNKQITQLPLEAGNVPSLSTLQTATTRDGYVAGDRANQSNLTLDGVDIDQPFNTYFLVPRNTNSSGETIIDIPSSLTWLRFQLALERAAVHENYRIAIKTAGGRGVTSIDWIEPLTPNQTIIDTPVVTTNDLPSGSYVLLLMAKERDGSFVKIAAYVFKVIQR